MENTNTNAEVISSQDLIADIFKDYKPAEAVVTPPTNEPAPQEAPPTIVPPVNEPPKVEEPVKISTDYSKRLKTAIADGLIENFAITYNEQEAFLEDIDDLNEEGYNEIIAAYKAEKDKNLKEKYISTDDFDEQTKKLIEIKKAGGKISEIIRENITAIEQLTHLKDNIDNENIQANIVGKDLEQKGNDLELIQEQIKRLKDRGELEDRANTILDNHLSLHNEAIEQKKQTELQRVEQEKEDLKNLRKNLSATYKEFGVPENIQKVLVDNATKLDADKISNTDKLYFEAIKDPKRYAEINYFLNNPEEFKKWVSSKQVLANKIDTQKQVLSININNQKKPKLSPTTVDEYAGQIIQNYNK